MRSKNPRRKSRLTAREAQLPPTAGEKLRGFLRHGLVKSTGHIPNPMTAPTNTANFMKRAIFGSLLCLGLLTSATLRAEDTNQIKQITVEDAKRLSQENTGRLLLNGLTILSDDAAKELARQAGWPSTA